MVATVTDYGVHSLWVSPDIDLHLVASSVSAAMAERAGGRAVVARLPVAPDSYHAPERREARHELGIEEDSSVALIAGGGWGIGDTEESARCVFDSGIYVLVVTGHNRSLKTRLENRYASERRVRGLGWTDQMPQIMAAADYLVQNAGGCLAWRRWRWACPLSCSM